jgi:hypothetical protein
MKCPNCDRSVSLLTRSMHEAEHDLAVAVELAEELRRSRAHRRQREADAELGRKVRIRQIMLRDDAKWKRRRRADETRAIILARAEKLRATPGPDGRRFDPHAYRDAQTALLNTLAQEFSKGRHKRSRETIRGYLAKSSKQK